MEDIIKQLEELNELSIKDGVAHQYMTISQSPEETVLSANKEGLIWLALEALKLAKISTEGSHLHIDEAGMADKADCPLILSYKNANWS